MKIKILILSFVLLLSCKETKIKYQEIRGEAQGTTFYISYQDSLKRDFSANISKLLQEFDEELNIYLPTSTVSLFNDKYEEYRANTGEFYFTKCLHKSIEFKKLTDGYFDHGMKNIIDFSKTMKDTNGDLEKVYFFKMDSIKKIDHRTQTILNHEEKLDFRAKFDFNAIAQGYSVDVLGNFLESQGVENYMIEIGGELKVKGNNYQGNKWSVGLESPNSEVNKREFQEIIYLRNKSLATSGSYRKFKEINGKKYSHVINPKTGFGVTHNLLSVTVITDDCMSADALATAFLVMGKEKTIQLIKDKEKLKTVSVYFIETDENGEFKNSFYNGFEKYLEE